ncbi:MAG: flagellar motor switch protein FliN [Phycisphaerales bacterium]|nr:MAG: flagellar motor switch protein FliN [Phycisphaerales bacterium]
MAEQTPNVDPETPADPPPSQAEVAADDQDLTDRQSASAEQIAAEALQSAEQAGQDIAAETGRPMDLPDLAPREDHKEGTAGALSMLNDVKLHVKIELGRTRMYVEDVLSLNENSVIELDKAAGDPVDIYVNDRHVARGEVLVLNDNFCVRISEIMQTASAKEDADQD